VVPDFARENMSMFLFQVRRLQDRLPVVVALAGILSAGGCQTAGQTKTTPARFDWDFKQIAANAPDRDETFKKCDRAAKDRARFVMNYEEQVSRYGHSVISCMRIEGWGITRNPLVAPPGRA
jgi:hypothetical protein